MEEATYQTSNADLMKAALEHYEDISSRACYWNSGIPRAIKFYYIARPRLEGLLLALQQQMDNERGRDGRLNIDGVLIKYQHAVIADILKESA